MSGWYGSLENRLMERTRSDKPEVGMGVTELCWSDRHAYEVVAVKDDKHITIRRLMAKRIDSNGFSESQEYEYSSNEEWPTLTLYKAKDGRWVRRIGRNGVDRTSGWYVGKAEEYYDPTF